jgi:SAM-dependent methyltransferase
MPSSPAVSRPLLKRYGVHVVRASERHIDSIAPESEAWTRAELRNLPERDDYVERNRAAWERWATSHLVDGRRAWQSDELRWGVWGTRESELGLLAGFAPGEDVIELGCGTGALSAWFARLQLRPVAVDFARAQLRAAESFQDEFGIWFPTVDDNAEHVSFDDASFDLAVSEYGVCLWSDPRRWLVEAHRLLRPEGRLVFVTSSPLLVSCTSSDGSMAQDRLVRDHFGRFRVEFEENGPVEFHLTHGHWLQLLRANGFVVDDLVEVRAHPAASPRYALATSNWAQRWPSEDIWVAHKA